MQANLILKKSLPSDITQILKKIDSNKFSLNMNSGCPMLKDFKCTIHKNKNRPEACKQFPIFIEGKTIRLSQRCPAVKEGLLYPFIKKMISQGYVLDKKEYLNMEIVDLNPGLRLS